MNFEALTVGIGILSLFVTILTATISGTAAILWRIARIDKKRLTGTPAGICVKHVRAAKKSRN